MQKSFFLILLLFSKESSAQINPGAKVPKINITNWIQNQPESIPLKDKFIVIDFWATWCAPCLASMAHMNTLVEENKTRNNLVFLAMSDEKKEKVSPILLRVPFKASVVTDTTRQTQYNFGITFIPNCIIVDDKGFVRWTGDPEQLTNDIIQTILAGKSSDVVNNEQVISEHSRKQYDSIKQKYLSIFNDNNVKDYFNLGPFLREGNGSKYNYNSPNSLRKVEIGIKLKDIISDQINISSSQISLPSDIDSSYVSYCYKSEKALTGKDVLRAIFTAANLVYYKTDSIQEVYLLEVVDSNLLNKHFVKNEQGGITHLSESRDGKFISMNYSPISSIISSLQKRFDRPIILKDPSILDQSLDMMLQTEDLETLKKSLRVYGINIKKKKQSLPFVKVLYN